jgi:uncharacterized protein (DUF1330 family)
MEVRNAIYPSADQIAAFFGLPEEGPFVMVNLLKFRDKAEYADGSEPELSGREAYERYGAEVTQLVESIGGRILYAGRVAGLMIGAVEDMWDAVALAQYPSLEAFRAMAISPGMRAIEHHRAAGLAGQLNIRTLART